MKGWILRRPPTQAVGTMWAGFLTENGSNIPYGLSIPAITPSLRIAGVSDGSVHELR